MVALIGRRIPTRYASPAAQEGSLGDIFSLLAKPYLDQLTPALKRQKLSGMEREEAGIRGVAAAIEAARGGSVDPYSLYSSGALGGMKGGDLGDYMLGITANTKGARDRATTNAAVGAGKGYGQTYHGVGDQLANQRTLQAMQEATKLKVEAQKPQTVLIPDEDGRLRPTVMRQSEAYGKPASVPLTEQQGAFAAANAGRLGRLSPAEQNFVGAQPAKSTPLSYATPTGGRGTTLDGGLTDAHTGEKLPAGTEVIRLEGPNSEGLGGATATNKILERRVAARQAAAAIDTLDKALTAPNADQAVGWIGKAAGLFNDVRSQYEAVVRLKGGLTSEQEFKANPGLAQSVDNVMRNPNFVETASRLGIQNAVLRSQIVDLAYTIAKTKDPGGRMSDQDIARSGEIIGASLMDPNAARQVLSELKTQIARDLQIWEEEFGRVRGGQRGSAPAPAAPAGAPSAPAIDLNRVKEKYGLE